MLSRVSVPGIQTTPALRDVALLAVQHGLRCDKFDVVNGEYQTSTILGARIIARTQFMKCVSNPCEATLIESGGSLRTQQILHDLVNICQP